MIEVDTILTETYGKICDEIVKAEKKFPGWPEDILHAVAIIQEECGELVRACLQNYYQHGDIEKVKRELYQTGAMVFRFAIGIEQGYIKETGKIFRLKEGAK